MANQSLESWLKPSSVFKRKRDDAIDDTSDKENTTTTTSASRKKAKSTPTSKPSKQSKKTPSSASAANKEAKKLYNDTLKALDKRVSELDKKVKVMSGNSYSITTASYATSAGKHLPKAKKLADTDPILAFNLLLSLADASHTDLDATVKMCGTPCDSSTPTFTALDEALLPLIEKREKTPQPAGTVLTPVPARWTRADADVGVFKTGWPNKQQRGQMYRQKLEWEKRRTAARRARRETASDSWMAVTLSDLKEERDYLDAYGVESYLPRSIARLEELLAGDGAATAAAAAAAVSE